MRINGLIPVSLVTLLSLGLCKGPNRKTNYFIPGYYVGANQKDEKDIYYLRVSSITEEAYKGYNGVNVIEDIAKGGYYYLDLYQLDESNNKVVTTFIDLKDSNVTNTMPVRYTDKNGNSIRPENIGVSGEIPSYTVILKQEEAESDIAIYLVMEDSN